MENTEELEIDIEDIGTILKSSRLKSKKSMEEISSELCIRKIYLTALEEGDYETLPPIPYGVGYVRTYARYLGLNPDRAVKLYKDASKIEEDKNEIENIVPEKNKSNSWHIVIGILALALLYGGWEVYSQKESKTKPATDVAAETVVAEEPQNVVPQEETTPVMENDNAVENESTSVKTENTPGAEDASMLQQTTLPTENAGMTGTVVQPEENTVIENESDNKVVVEFSGESWVELKGRDKVYFQGVFHAGDRKEIDYVDNLFLSVGRPENVKVYVKGAEKNILNRRRKTNIPVDALE